MQRHIKHIPLDNAVAVEGAFLQNTVAQLVGFQVCARGGAIYIFVAYHRGGPQQEIFQAVARHTAEGHIPFALLADFNADQESHAICWWAEKLGAATFAPKSCTC